DHTHCGPLALERRADDVELRLRENRDIPCATESLGPQFDLCDRLLTGDEQGMSSGAHGGKSGQQERRLADTGLAADEHERRRHEAAAEHAVELLDAGGDPLGLLDLDVDEAQERFRSRSMTQARSALFDECPKRAAARAAPEPAGRRGAALAACVLDGSRLR